VSVRIRQLTAIVLWALVVLLVGVLVGAGETSGQTSNRAGLIVWFEDGNVESRQVEFSEDSISGSDLLRRAGLGVVFAGYGGLGSGVCKIDDTGCGDPSDCFCQCRSADCRFWRYFTLVGETWRFQNIGASTRRLHDGDVDAWVWGTGREPPPSLILYVPPDPTPAPAPTQPPAPNPNGGETVVPQQNGGEDGGDQSGPGEAPVVDQTSVVSAPETAGPPRETLDAAPRGTSQVRSGAATPLPDVPGADAAREEDDDDTGATGLIAFAATASAIVLATGALLTWRRMRG
jgi:hypothetical protein